MNTGLLKNNINTSVPIPQIKKQNKMGTVDTSS